MPEADPLPRAFFERSPIAVARDLLGCVLATNLADGATSGRIVEAEAYLGPDDPASHAAKQRRGRVTAMAGPCGIAYVYRSYGLHAMLNVVAHQPDAVGAVLIRAIEPLTGLEAMRRRRGVEDGRLLAAGPGRLCQALGITLDDHGADLVAGDRIRIMPGAGPDEVLASGRIGVSRGAEAPWRFFVAGSRYVSAHRRGIPAPPAVLR